MTNADFTTHNERSYKKERELASESAQEFGLRMKKAWTEAQAALKIVADLTKARIDRQRRPSRAYAMGDLVWLEATNVCTTRQSKKLDDRCIGPYKITEKVAGKIIGEVVGGI